LLVLTRRIGESLCIGSDITVTVINVDRGQVRIGISAPRKVIVDREEIAAKRISNPIFRRDRGTT
jgi:carbon storage regulator